MKAEALPDDLLLSIEPESVSSYAIGKGWLRDPDDSDGIALFSYPGNRLTQIILPLTADVDDYARSISGALDRLARIEGRSALQILNDLLIPRADTLRFRIVGKRTAKGMVQIQDGVRLYEGMRDSLLSAACGVLSPRKFYHKLARRGAEEFLRACWLGQTERGSYVATLSCPMNVMPERKRDNIPFSRQATGLLLNTMATVARAIEAEEEDKLIDLQDENVVVSANLCEAIMSMQPEDESSTLSINCSWAKALMPAEGVYPNEVEFKGRYRSSLQSLSKALKPSSVAGEMKIYTGTISSLKSEPNVLTRKLGEVVVNISVDGLPKHVKVELSPTQYAEACNAHRDGNAVLIEGVVLKGIRSHRIANPKQFLMLPKS